MGPAQENAVREPRESRRREVNRSSGRREVGGLPKLMSLGRLDSTLTDAENEGKWETQKNV